MHQNHTVTHSGPFYHPNVLIRRSTAHKRHAVASIAIARVHERAKNEGDSDAQLEKLRKRVQSSTMDHGNSLRHCRRQSV